ncbi:MAG: hypothetical protein RIT45_2710 [Pseudomonadota bacterium]|jgi:phosphoribosylaminoimidazolecarboxamide formyltransferase/IMP cyclohydrolase
MPFALLSVHDKTGLPELATGLTAAGYELVASGGTARVLREAGLSVRDVAEVTGAPEMLGGRVKTLHPAIAGGILARRNLRHLADLEQHGITPIDVVVCNLYPFAETVAREVPGEQPEDRELRCVEEIDIGGVTLLRAAAKNFESVVVVCDPARYADLLASLPAGGPDVAARRALALAAFRHTAAYDAAIAAWMSAEVAADVAPTTDTDADADADDALPARIVVRAERVQTLRYGENPHQSAALYRPEGAAPRWRQLGGKELSYNNLVDLEAAWPMPQGFAEPAVAIVKHTNPCGLAVGPTLEHAFERALAADPQSAFGSIVAVNRPVTAAFVRALGPLFVEILAAPAFDDDALALLATKKKNARLMQALPTLATDGLGGLELRLLGDGLLVQTCDPMDDDATDFRVVSERAPSAAEIADLAFAWQVAAHVKSNAIVLAKAGAAVGVGAGQMSRVDAVELAVRRAGAHAAGSVLASDAFFPFPDGVQAAAAAGVTAVVQPGGSMRDEQVIEAANRLGLAMWFTGRRHFRH